MRPTQQILSFLLFATLFGGVCGCATDNEWLIKHSCIFERRSDKIPGLMSPRDRMKLIQQKAKNAQNASATDRNIVVAQLVCEYQDSTDPNMRREAITAIGRIPHPDRIGNLKLALHDPSVPVRVAATQGLVRNHPKGTKFPEEIEHTLRNLIENDPDKDVRIMAIQALKEGGKTISPDSLAVLEQCLSDNALAIRYETTGTLAACTGKDYGTNVDRWLAHFQYKKGETPLAPSERSLKEKVAIPRLPMFQ
ncbi:MAG: HEAT repeat domain-containing protein [Thermoguttaceae bacterium]